VNTASSFRITLYPLLGLAALCGATAGVQAQKPAEAAKPEPPIELEAHRKPTLVTRGDCFIQGGTLLTVTNGVIPNGSILIQKGKIVAIGANLTPPAGIPVIDASGKFVTPGIVDAHSHIASDATNEGTDSVTAEVRIHDILDPQSITLWRGLGNGVTTSLILHGSANAIGGQSVVIKMKWRHPVEDLIVPDAPRMIKFALGENVKRSGRSPGEAGRFPSTRMGVEAVYRRAFTEARTYQQAWERYEKERQAHPDAVPPRRDLRLETLADILRGKIWVHCHSYRADEMLMMLQLSKEFGFKLAALQHALEAYKIAPEILAQGVGVSTFADAWAYKLEAFEAIPYNAALCMQAGILTSVNSDNTAGTYRLNLEAAKCMKYGGLTETEALRLITINPATQLGIAHRTGSLEVGKDGDITLWEGHPLSVYSKCLLTMVEGEVLFQRRDAFGVDPASLIRRELTACPADHLALPTPPPGSTYALVGGVIHPVQGPDIPNGTLIISGGRIQAIGPKIAIPRGAIIVPARGLHLYPGMIDAGSVLGLEEIGQVSASEDATEGGMFQPDLRALTAVNPASEHFSIARNEGVTTALTRPLSGGGGFRSGGGGSLIAGQSAVIDLAGWTPDEMKVQSPAMLHVTFPEGARGLSGGARSFLPAEMMQQMRDGEKEQVRRLREYFERAKRYAASRGQSPDPSPADAPMEAMVPYVTGKLPVVFNVSTAYGIRAVVQFADQLGLKAVIATGGEVWKEADLLARKHIPVIYTLPVENSLASWAPRRDYDPYDSVFAAPALLQRAGVPLCFASNSASLSKNLPTQVGITCAYGLSHEAALKALTLGAAQVLGVADSVGSLEPGKIANVLVTDGDPLEITTHLHALFIAGKPIPLESKHTHLYQTYRQRLPQGRTAASAGHNAVGLAR
jgi:imidazolonepropionase-like amidohydrolase